MGGGGGALSTLPECPFQPLPFPIRVGWSSSTYLPLRFQPALSDPFISQLQATPIVKQGPYSANSPVKPVVDQTGPGLQYLTAFEALISPLGPYSLSAASPGSLILVTGSLKTNPLSNRKNPWAPDSDTMHLPPKQNYLVLSIDLSAFPHSELVNIHLQSVPKISCAFRIWLIRR